jgi:hypothetical protein
MTDRKKMRDDTTIMFLTVNKVPEHWRQFHKQKLLEAAGRLPIVTVSRIPMPDMPGQNIIQTEPICASNVYWQILKVAKLVKTPYIAIAEDDSLYPYDHFHSFRPADNHFSYNMSRWSLYEWRKPAIYAWRDRISNLTLIAPRELAITALEERFRLYPDGTPDRLTGELGKKNTDFKLGTTHIRSELWNSDIAILNINHQYSMDDRELRQVKKPGSLRAYDIPYWGRAEDIIKEFK